MLTLKIIYMTIERPPSTMMVCPRIISEPSEIKNMAVLTISSISTMRPAGVFFLASSNNSSRFGKCFNASVSSAPPETVFTAIPFAASSTAK